MLQHYSPIFCYFLGYLTLRFQTFVMLKITEFMPRICHEIRGKYIWTFTPRYLQIMVCYLVMFRKLFKNYTCTAFCINSVFLILTVADMITAGGTLKNRRWQSEQEDRRRSQKYGHEAPAKATGKRKGGCGCFRAGEQSSTQGMFNTDPQRDRRSSRLWSECRGTRASCPDAI